MSMPEINKYTATYNNVLRSNPDNSDLNKSIGMCYLKLKMPDKALKAFEKAIEDDFNDSDLYYYAAICSLGGKKAFLNQRPAIDKAIEYINAALMVEEKGIYDYLLAYIKYDYFERKSFITSPNYKECLNKAKNAGVTDQDISQMYLMLNVSRPEVL